ncbi:unnamed protein product [Trypanosoma congolense IL3000]|uniref:WGS project CAEQ00000000 data, annotated contig 580 n=1 Tax=Trypanosoma congolense (strain IL3000) TaxID=1068625 RepID=F9WH15_TRYCI|nr:unnamed protein product [Trypanosoma congolense IL3000]
MNKAHGSFLGPTTGQEDNELVRRDWDTRPHQAMTLSPNPTYTMTTSVLDVLLDGLRDTDNLNLLHFLEPWYEELPLHLLRFTVGDFMRNPERCIPEDRLRQEIRDKLDRMLRDLYKELLDQFSALHDASIVSLEDWAQRGSSCSLTVHELARGFLDKALKKVQETHTQAEAPVQVEKPVQRKPRGPRQGPVFLPSSSPSTSVSSCHRRESSPSSDVEFLVEFPSLKKEEVSSHGTQTKKRKRRASPHRESNEVNLQPKPQEVSSSGTQPAPRRKRPASPSMESLREAIQPMPQEATSSGAPPTRQQSQESYSDVEFFGSNPPPSRRF